jgi:hypothetical protein
MTERNYRILKNEIHSYQEFLIFQMKKILFKIIPYIFIVYEFNPTIFWTKLC